MLRSHARKVVFLPIVMLLSACVTGSEPGILEPTRNVQFVGIDVENRSGHGSVNFNEHVRHMLQSVAYHMSEQGEKRRLKVVITDFNRRSPERALLLDDASTTMNSVVTQMDVNGRPLGEPISVRTVLRRNGGSVGEVQSRLVNSIEEEWKISKNLALDVYERIYGVDRYQAEVRRNPPSQEDQANYPADYMKLHAEERCRVGYAWNKEERQREERGITEARLIPVQKFCPSDAASG